MLHPLAKKYLIKFLFFFWFVVTSPPLLLLIWLRQSYPTVAPAISWIAIPLALAWLYGSWWLALTTAHHMVNENRMFLTAVKYTFCDLRFRLAFLPLLGWLFTPDRENKHDDDDV
ncbi:MAG: hypothetical protein JWM68_996 [Verrucomicrobiales bacterium]|nr:hypothetical protein [Verrucomicrobiales bacterium]